MALPSPSFGLATPNEKPDDGFCRSVVGLKLNPVKLGTAVELENVVPNWTLDPRDLLWVAVVVVDDMNELPKEKPDDLTSVVWTLTSDSVDLTSELDDFVSVEDIVKLWELLNLKLGEISAKKKILISLVLQSNKVCGLW